MNVLHQYTRKSLLENRTRTVVTVIGIILSLAMLTAVTTLISSVQRFMIEGIESASGGWHCAGFALSRETEQAAAADGRTEWLTGLERTGYAAFDEAENPDKPYLYVAGMQDGFADRMPIVLTGGRLPESADEILIPEHLLEQNAYAVKIGDALNLTLCDRLDRDTGVAMGQETFFARGEEGEPLEELVARETRTYTVVGFYERPTFEDYMAPGYTLLTVADGSGVYADAWVRLKNPNDAQAFGNDHFYENAYTLNMDLLRMTGSSGENAYNAVLYSLGVIFIAIILLASIFLIYNAFSISVSERTRQFGLLSSVGATRRQLARCVLYEALTLSGVGIPLGILSGIAGIGVTLTAVSGMLGDIFSDTFTLNSSIRLHVSWQSVAIAAALGLLTVLFSAELPARRATRVSAIDAIRQTADVKIRPRSVRTSRFTGKLFGFEGTLASKNFKRARRKYRVTVFSLSVSIVLFISASSFCVYLTDSAGDVLSDYSFDLMYVYANDDASVRTGSLLDAAAPLHEKLSQTEGAEQSALHAYGTGIGTFSTDSFSRDFRQDILSADADTVSLDVGVIFCDDSVYVPFVKSLGLGKEYLSGEKVIAVNRCQMYNAAEERYYVYEPLNGACRFQLSGQTVEIGALTQKCPFGADISSHTVTVLAPASAVDYFGLDVSFRVYSVFLAPDHATVGNRMTMLLRELEQPSYLLSDYAASVAATRSLLTVIKVFSYGFITLISLIALANVFNTISTNVQLRRREFATLLSVGMTRRSFHRMLNYECLLYGLKGLAFGLPASVLTTWLIHRSFSNGLAGRFYMPWGGVVIAVFSVFLVVFATMLYERRKLRACNLIDVLKLEA